MFRNFMFYRLLTNCVINNIYHARNFVQHANGFLLSSSLLTWIGFEDDEEKESELITTLKRSILCIQRKEYVKAEQMLHIALRLAQEQSNFNGVTYSYDLMANLALEREQFDKAEKLFVSVLQRLLSTGTPEKDVKVIHISLKLAKISQMKNQHEKAEIGYIWCLESIKHHSKDDNDILNLNGIILDWYAHFLAERGNYGKSLQCLEEAYQICLETEGVNSEKSVLLLNDMGTINWQSGNYEIANQYLSTALKFGQKLDNFEQLGVIYANLGLTKFKLGLMNEAKKFCAEGWRVGNKDNNADAMNQANYCFEQMGAHL